IEDIGGAVRAKLEEGKESAYMSRDLARIMFDAPVKLSEMKDFVFDKDKVIEGLKKLEFNSLIRRISKDMVDSDKDEELGDSQEYEVIDDAIVDYDIKTLMHSDEGVAKEILGGKSYWDLTQAEFLLNPLVREVPRLALLMDEYRRQLKEYGKYPKLYDILTKFDLPLIPVLYKMEQKGMLIDREYFEGLKSEYTAEAKEIEEQIYDKARKVFNVNSPVQLSEVLFGDLKLSVKGIKKTTRGYSTGAKELDKLKGTHPIIELIIRYREIAKLLSTYVIPMPDMADAEGRIHTTFTQNVTATGRLSSLNPNLQNIPVRTEEGKRIRMGFVAPDGKVLVSADYSQFELRLAAILAGDQALIDDFNAGIDIHTKTAAEAFHVPFEEVTKAQRRAAKVINFGVLYGMSVKGLADAAKMSVTEAKKFIDNYFELRAPIKRKLEEILKQARERGYVETYYGRRRPTPDVKSSNFLIRQAAERAAQNMPIQGTEADLMKRAMINVDRALPEGAELVMQVHDSLMVECDESIAEKVSDVLKREMEKVAPELKIKLAVEVTAGKNWGEL
ncbi:DNA polymerase I, partial [Candidatus Saccharibacteria bacterium]|nr:DNA polymerase I [Candidatus Saccharibacteria bacterium]